MTAQRCLCCWTVCGRRTADSGSSPCSADGLGLHSVFSWVGQTFYKLRLKPQAVLCVRLQACFFQPGVYNLNTPQVFAKPADQGAELETSQQAASPALIIINSA